MRDMLTKIMRILDRQQKRGLIVLLLMMLVGGALETLGIAILVPILTSVMEPEAIRQNVYHMGDLYRMLGMTSTTQFAVVMMILIVVVFAVKNIFLYIQNRYQLRFIYTHQFETSQRMMINFMKRPYEYYLNADTSVIQRSITSDINNVYALILTILQLTSEIIVFGFLVAFLLMVDAGMTLSIATLLILVLAVIKWVIKPVMIRAGKDNQDYYSGLYKWIDQSVMGIKEIKVAGRENYFINAYADCGKGYVNAVQKYNLYNSTPRLLIETVAIGGLMAYMIFQILRGQVSSGTLISQLGVLAAAAARLLPSANRINNFMTSIAYFGPFLDNVSANLQEDIHDGSIDYSPEKYETGERSAKLPLTRQITVKGLDYRYPNTEVYILKNADIEIPVGLSVGIVGSSGAGKSTLIDVLLGLLRPEAGQILADDTAVTADNMQSWLRNVGYIPQTIFMLDDSIRKNVAFGVPEAEIDDEKVWAALKEAQLDEHVRSLPEGLDTQIGERGIRLSGGQRQRIGIARALFEDPELLVLDEATSALDGETEQAIMDSINRLHGRKTMIIIAHRLQTIEKCDRVYRVADGQITRER